MAITFTELDKMTGQDLADAVYAMTPSRRKAAYQRYKAQQSRAIERIPREFDHTSIRELRRRDEEWAQDLDRAYARIRWFEIGIEQRYGPDWSWTQM